MFQGASVVWSQPRRLPRRVDPRMRAGGRRGFKGRYRMARCRPPLPWRSCHGARSPGCLRAPLLHERDDRCQEGWQRDGAAKASQAGGEECRAQWICNRRGTEKKANLSQMPAARRSMPVKPESVDSTPNDASSEVKSQMRTLLKPTESRFQQKWRTMCTPLHYIVKPFVFIITIVLIRNDVIWCCVSRVPILNTRMLLPLVLVSAWRSVLRSVKSS